MKVEIGIISGSGAYELGAEILEEFEAETPYGKPSSKVQIVEIEKNRAAFIRRHGPEHSIPPHRINHRANIYALHSLGVENVISLGSVGSLKEGIKPPATVIPEDYISPFRVDTFFEDRVEHIAPELDEELRKELKESALELGIDVRYGGVYLQTLGPRLETKAEIRMYCRYADIVGMTVGSEAALSQELGMKFAAICSVDNYAHGISGEIPNFQEILKRAKTNQEKSKAIVLNFIEKY